MQGALDLPNSRRRLQLPVAGGGAAADGRVVAAVPKQLVTIGLVELGGLSEHRLALLEIDIEPLTKIFTGLDLTSTTI